jgi:hypothetical protein
MLGAPCLVRRGGRHGILATTPLHNPPPKRSPDSSAPQIYF